MHGQDVSSIINTIFLLVKKKKRQSDKTNSLSKQVGAQRPALRSLGRRLVITAESGYQQKTCSFPLFWCPVMYLFVKMMNFLDEKKILSLLTIFLFFLDQSVGIDSIQEVDS